MVYPGYEMQNLTDDERLALAMQADMDDVSTEELEAASDLLDRVLAEFAAAHDIS